jgi:serine/threonine protein kinase
MSDQIDYDIKTNNGGEEVPLLGLSPFKPSSSPSISLSQHLTLFLSLAADARREALQQADYPLANFLRNIRDHDVGLITPATEFIRRGATFAVRRTVIPDHTDVVFKSCVRGKKKLDDTSITRRLELVLLELRILAHEPLRAHDNIVNLIAVGWEGDARDVFRKWPVLVVEYADLGTLDDYFESRKPSTWPILRKLCYDVAKGLSAIHQCGITHGDLKLGNVLVFSNGDGSVTAKLSDLGGALLDSDDLQTIPMATRPWNCPHTDVSRDSDRLRKSDVYSLGLVIWRIVLNGADPFQNIELFPISIGCPIESANMALEHQKSDDVQFLSMAKKSVLQNNNCSIDHTLLFNIFEVSIRYQEELRDLGRILKLLDPLRSESVKSDLPVSLLIIFADSNLGQGPHHAQLLVLSIEQ